MGNTNYQRGSMEIGEQSSTFGGFMGGMTYGGAAIVLILLYPALIFAVKMAWAPSLLITLVLGIIIGIVLKLKGGWYAGVIGLSAITALFTALASALLS